jgi:hypothetical protein
MPSRPMTLRDFVLAADFDSADRVTSKDATALVSMAILLLAQLRPSCSLGLGLEN